MCRVARSRPVTPHAAIVTVLHHLASAWFAASVPYLLDIERLPSATVTLTLSTVIAATLGSLDALRTVTKPLHIDVRRRDTMQQSRRSAAPGSTLEHQRVAPTPDPPPASAPVSARQVARRYERADDPLAQLQCPNCGGFDGIRALGIGLRCDTCAYEWSAGRDQVVEVRSWLHQTETHPLPGGS